MLIGCVQYNTSFCKKNSNTKTMLTRVFFIIVFLFVFGSDCATTALRKCLPGEFRCQDGSCILKDKFCNNVMDCTSGEDELPCNSYLERGSSTSESPGCPEFECNSGYCIPYVWVCDGYDDCAMGEDESHCVTDFTSTTTHLSTAITHIPTGSPTTSDPRSCPHPYDRLGDRCVLIDPVLHATWDEARYICGWAEGGDLVVLDSMDFYADLIQYMQAKGLDTHDYWVGGRGNHTTGQWSWVSGTEVYQGTPLWALYNQHNYNYSYSQEPVNFAESLYGCGYVQVDRFYFMDVDSCTNVKPAICQMSTWSQSQKKIATSFQNSHLETMVTPGFETAGQVKSESQASCKSPYDLVGDRCVLFDPVMEGNWNEARYICGLLDGDLVVLDSMSFFQKIIQYMITKGLNRHDYWIGGFGVHSEYSWKWLSGTKVLMDTPLWALEGSSTYYEDDYEMEPLDFEESLQNCGYLERRRYHYMSHSNCYQQKAAICQTPTWTLDQEGMDSIPDIKEVGEERYKELREILATKIKSLRRDD